MHRRTILKLSALLPLVLAVALLGACGGDDDDGGATAPTATTAPNGNGNVVGDELDVIMHDNYFEPAEFTIAVGQTVSITAINEGIAVHNMAVLNTDFKSDAIVTPGGESTFEVRFDTPGTYPFQCDYHLPDMVGTITVR